MDFTWTSPFLWSTQQSCKNMQFHWWPGGQFQQKKRKLVATFANADRIVWSPILDWDMHRNQQHSKLQYSFAFIFQLEGSVVLRDLHRAACPLSGQWNMMLLVRMHSAQRRLPPRHQWLVFAEMPPIVRHNQVKVASKLSKPNIPFILSP